MTGLPLEFALAAMGGLLVGLAFARWRVARRAARSRRIGARAEVRARRILRAAGYRVVEWQPSALVQVEIDGRAETFPVRGDVLVRRRRRLYLAEIKGGPAVSTLAHRGTRRQLLEYACAFRVDGVLLVDMHRRAVRRIRFRPVRSLDDPAARGAASLPQRRRLTPCKTTRYAESMARVARIRSPSQSQYIST